MKLLKMLGEWWTEYLDYLLLWILLGFIFWGRSIGRDAR